MSQENVRAIAIGSRSGSNVKIGTGLSDDFFEDITYGNLEWRFDALVAPKEAEHRISKVFADRSLTTLFLSDLFALEYQREVIDMTANPQCERISLMWAAQVCSKTLTTDSLRLGRWKTIELC
ncbi:hypothetical protein [Pseudophaeobacter sp.]|uniref:hypothetical protein n=1 Tax=Pseudophaeobacter sp. TaxID=1971739 RepID=UPI0032988E15